MTGRRRELADAARLLASEERWAVTDLVVGVVVAVCWFLATGVLGPRAAAVAGFQPPTGPGGTWSLPWLAAVAVVWLVVPAVAAVVRLRSRVLNIHGNVEQYYRFDHPAVLLAPPAGVLAALAVAAVAFGTVPWGLFALAVPATLYLAARTLAYCYRVYAVSRPLALQAALAGGIAVQFASLLGFAGVVAGRRPLVVDALGTAGLPVRLVGSVRVGRVGVFVPLALAVAAPVAVVVAYLLVQAAGALVVRLRSPAVDPTTMRSGQRYPPFLDTAPAATGGSGPATSGRSTNGEAPADASGESSEDDADEDDENLDDVSNTRVFVPPSEDDDDDAFDASSGTAGGADLAGDGTAEPSPEDAGGSGGAAAVSTEAETERRRCDACTESFSVDATVRFCPNCGAAFGD